MTNAEDYFNEHLTGYDCIHCSGASSRMDEVHVREFARLKSQEDNKDVNELNDKQVKLIQGLNKELAAEMIAVKELVEALRKAIGILRSTPSLNAGELQAYDELNLTLAKHTK